MILLKQKKMKYKVIKNTETYNRLVDLEKKIIDANLQTKNVVELVSGLRYCANQNSLAGGISAIEFKTKPDGFKSVGNKYQSLYYPKASNKKVCDLINNLPKIKYDELNTIVDFKAPQTISTENSLCWVSTVGIIFHKENILINVNNGCDYTPLSDMIEIVESEYENLKNNGKVK
jgi:hypothetical protein